MSMHRKPLTPLEREGLEKHGLGIGTPSQLSDVFRQGIAWALSQQNANSPQADGMVLVDRVEYEVMKERATIDHVRQLEYWKILVKHGLSAEAEKAVSAYKPQADGMNATREELDRFLRDMRDGKPNPKAQETLSRGRAILRQMEAQADDVRKDAERFVAWFSSNKICDAIPHDFKMLGEEPTLDQWREAIDKARE